VKTVQDQNGFVDWILFPWPVLKEKILPRQAVADLKKQQPILCSYRYFKP
jgi:hypothetical protein